MSRQKKEIKWEFVERQMEAGCSGIEIAETLRVDANTFYRRFENKYGKRFADYRDGFYSAGNANIKTTQYLKAISGNIPMLILLGRERLGQSKEQEKISPFEDTIALRHENMMLSAEIEKLKEKLNAYQPKAE